jgi:thioredoxin-related protein
MDCFRLLFLSLIVMVCLVCQTKAIVVAQSTPGNQLTEAIEMASTCGFPMLVVASQESCNPCMALKQDLRNNPDVRGLLDGCLKVYIDCDAPEYLQWTQLHRPSNRSLPQVFLIRCDGKELLNQSGRLSTEQLMTTLEEALRGAGKILNEDESLQIRELTGKLQQLVDKGKIFEAADTILDSERTLRLAVNCFAAPAIEMRTILAMVKQELLHQIELTRNELHELKNLPMNQRQPAAERIQSTLINLSRFRPIASELSRLQEEANSDPQYLATITGPRAYQTFTKSD